MAKSTIRSFDPSKLCSAAFPFSYLQIKQPLNATAWQSEAMFLW
jgi:hypothetical protein